MTKLKIERLQKSILSEIASVVNNSMSMDDKLAIVKATIDRYGTQLETLSMNEAIKRLAKEDNEIVEAKYND